jgi:hypothetical protein
VTWFINSQPLSSQELVTTQYTNESAGNTSLQFVQLSRHDRGMYTVIIDNNMTLLHTARNSVRTNFTVIVNGMYD